MTSSRNTRIAIGALTLVYLALTIPTAWMDSTTGDEVSHLPAGYSYVATGDFRMNIQHPPLVKILAGIPLLALDLKPVDEIPGWNEAHEWDFGRNFLTDNNQSIQLITFTGRLPMILVGLFLGLVMFLWSRELWGERTAILVFFLFVFSPTLLAHARLVTTDVGISAFTVATVAALWMFSKTERIEWALAASVAIGCALLTKYSGLLTLVIAFTLLAGDWLLKRFLVFPRGKGSGVRGTGISNDSPLEQDVSSVSATEPLLTSPAGESALRAPSGTEARRSSELSPNLSLYVGAAILFLVIPAYMIAGLFDPPYGLQTYYRGFNRLFADFNPLWEAYLWGEWSKDGFWYYYLFAQLWKTPLPTLFLFGGALLLIDFRDRESLKKWIFILLPWAAFHAAGMRNDANIGIRHVMPIFPFMMIAAGGAIRWLVGQGRAARAVLLALFLWYAGGTLAVFPHFLPYFNELAGGVEGGVQYLDDSNIQWGENFFHLRDYIENHPAEESYLEAFSGLNASYFGVDVSRMSLRDVVWPREGVTYYVGGSLLRRSSLSVDFPGIRFQWVERGYRPVDRVGSIFVYRFTTDQRETDAYFISPDDWYSEGLEQIDRISRLNPGFEQPKLIRAEIWDYRAARYESEGEIEESFRARLAAAALSSPTDPGKGERMSRAVEAILVLVSTMVPPESAQASDKPPADYLLALVSLRQGDEPRALMQLIRAVRSQPTHIPSRTLLADRLHRLGFVRLATLDWIDESPDGSAALGSDARGDRR